MTCPLLQILLGYQIKEDEIGGVCVTDEGNEKCVQYLVEELKGREHLKNLGVDGNNIRMDLREIGWKDMDWMYLDQDRDQWQALVNTVMNFRVPYHTGNLLNS
jgi:hypothetical protein